MAFSLEDSFNDFLKNAPRSAVTGKAPGGLPKQVMNGLLSDMLDKDGDNNPIAPDTHGVDCFFVRSFVNEEIRLMSSHGLKQSVTSRIPSSRR